MKYELKIEFKDTKLFIDYIKKAYKNGILSDRKQKFTFDNTTSTYDLCKGLPHFRPRCARKNSCLCEITHKVWCETN